MPKFNASVPNPVDKETALKNIHSYLEKLMEKYQDQVSEVEQNWEGDTVNFSLKAYGFKVSGTGNVTEEEVQIEGDLPFAAAMFKGKIVSTLQEQLVKVLNYKPS